jgi:HlyD family secretion protein
VILAKDGKAALVEVTTGISDATHVVIASGLKLGDPVITGPFRTLKKLKGGDSVLVTKEETKTSDSKSKSKDKDEE